MLRWLKELFGASDCRACIARDYHIGNLKELLREEHALVCGLQARIAELENRNELKLQHFLGMSSATSVAAQGNMGQVHSIQRQGSIQSRIRRAESLSSDPVLTAQRSKEYNDRIAALTSEARPETEIVSDPNQPDRQEKDAV